MKRFCNKNITNARKLRATSAINQWPTTDLKRMFCRDRWWTIFCFPRLLISLAEKIWQMSTWKFVNIFFSTTVSYLAISFIKDFKHDLIRLPFVDLFPQKISRRPSSRWSENVALFSIPVFVTPWWKILCWAESKLELWNGQTRGLSRSTSCRRPWSWKRPQHPVLLRKEVFQNDFYRRLCWCINLGISWADL